MNSRLDEQLQLLNRELIEMGALCEEAIDAISGALQGGDAGVARKVAPLEAAIDHKERAIEAICLRLLLQQHPVARDLRQVSAALKMITDMERIGDQALDIAEIISESKVHTFHDAYVAEMSAAAGKMVTDSIDAFVRRDVAAAQAVIAADDVVDKYFAAAKHQLIEMISTKAADGEVVLDLLMIVKYFERIGDHAANIAEWVEFAVTGVHKGEVEL